MRDRLERIETTSANFTISLRVQPPGLTVINEAGIPEWFWIPQPAKLDRRKVLDTLKAGTAVMGTELANSRVNLVVRIK